MNTRGFIDQLFSGYEETGALIDFKEELLSNLVDRIAALKAKGLDEEAAFYKATDELGDISVLADEISLQKKQEVFESAYLKTRTYISNGRVGAYLMFAGFFLLGAIIGLLCWLNLGFSAPVFAASMPFFLLSTSALVAMGLTQETARLEPMPWRRAIVYAIFAFILLLGLFLFSMLFFFRLTSLTPAILTLIPIGLPSILVLAFLVLTEKPRHKSWVKVEEEKWMKQYTERFRDLETATRYGLACGALWIFVFAAFLVLGFALGFRYAWIIFIVAAGLQLVIEYIYSGKKVQN